MPLGKDWLDTRFARGQVAVAPVKDRAFEEQDRVTSVEAVLAYAVDEIVELAAGEQREDVGGGMKANLGHVSNIPR